MRSIAVSARLLIAMTILLGFVYPAAVAAVGRAAFPARAEGSLVEDASGRVRGSLLLAQAESRPSRFHPRPSASAFDGCAGAGSNLGPASAALEETAAARRRYWVEAVPGADVPAELIRASGSGLDPHLSAGAALYQAPRIAAALGIEPREVEDIVAANVEGPYLGFMGPPRVNVLRLNLALEERYPPTPPGPAE